MFAAISPSPGAPFSYSAATFSSYWEYRKNGSGAGWSGRGLQEIAPKSSSPTGDARRKKKAVRVRRGASIGLLPTRAVVFLVVAAFFFFSLKAVVGGPWGDKGGKQNQGGGNNQKEGVEMDALPQVHLTALRSVASALFATTWRVSSDKNGVDAKKKVVDTKKTGVDTQKRGSVRNKYRVLAEI